MKVKLLDATQFLRKTKTAVHAGDGTIDGCTKAEIWKKSDTYAHDLSGMVLAQMEDGKDADSSTLEGLQFMKDDAEAIAAKAHLQKPGIRVVWYTPKAARSDFFWSLRGDRGAIERMEAHDAYIASLIAHGMPGHGLAGVFIDLYDFESISACWKARAKAAFAPWRAANIVSIPILMLRFKDTGALYTPELARERIQIAADLSSTGEVCIFDGVNINEQPEDFASWSLATTVKSIAAGK